MNRCDAAEFADILFEIFVVKQQPDFLSCVLEENPKVETTGFDRLRFGLLVSAVILSLQFSTSPKEIVSVTARRLTEKADLYAKAVWSDKSFGDQLVMTLGIYHDCVVQTKEKGRPSLVWLSKVLEAVGMVVTNAITLIMVADQLMNNFIGIAGAIKDTEVV